MKKIYQMKQKQIFVFLLLCVILLFHACQKDEHKIDDIQLSNKHLQTKSTQSNINIGESLFRAIFLIQGELAHKIRAYEPLLKELEIRESEISFLEQRNIIADSIISIVRQSNKQYFYTLYNSVKSKDINQIESTLAIGMTLLTSVMDSIYVDSIITDLSTPYLAPVFALVPVAVVAAVFWEAVAVVNVAVAATAFWKAIAIGYTKSIEEMENVSKLEIELFLKDISKLLN